MEIQLVKMSSFNDLIKSGKIKAAFLLKQAKLTDINDKAQMINGLDTENPNSRSFNRLDSNADKSVSELKAAIEDLSILLRKANPDIAKDESYIADTKFNRSAVFVI